MPTFKHQSAEDRIKSKMYRRKPKVKRSLKIRRAKNAKAPNKNISWSSKTRSYTTKDPNRRRTMKLVAKFRRKPGK